MRTAAYNVDVAMRPPQAPEFAVQTLCSFIGNCYHDRARRESLTSQTLIILKTGRK